MSDAAETGLRRFAPSAKAQFLIIAGIFAAPLIAAVLLAFFFPDARPLGRTNKGVLVTPAQPLPVMQWTSRLSEKISAQVADGNEGDAEPGDGRIDIRGKWTLLTIGPANCDQGCADKLYNLRQIRTSTGRRRIRVQQIHMLQTADEMAPAFVELISSTHPRLQVVSPESAVLEALEGVAESYPQTKPEHYIVDPNGNLMMFYGAEHGNRDVLDDLMRLLKTSQIG